MTAQQLDAPHHAVERGLSPFVDPVGVVQLGGPVDADPDKEAVLREKLAPLVRQAQERVQMVPFVFGCRLNVIRGLRW